MAKKPPMSTSPAAQVLEAPRFRAIDAAMILLALVSAALVFLDIFWRAKLYEWGIFRSVIIADGIITLVFLVSFFGENRGKPVARVLRDSWFDIVGLAPLVLFVWIEAAAVGVPFSAAFNGEVQLLGGARAGGLLRLFRFVRIIRIVQAFSRFLRATNMTFGEQVTKRVFDKYRRIIVAELTTPILVAGLTVTQEIVIRMKFLDSIGQSIDAKRPEIHAAIIETLEKNKVPEHILTKPFVDKLVKDMEEAVVNALVATLTGPELNRLTQEMIVDVMENFKEQLQSPEGKALLKQMGTAPPTQRSLPPPGPPAAEATDGPSPF